MSRARWSTALVSSPSLFWSKRALPNTETHSPVLLWFTPYTRWNTFDVKLLRYLLSSFDVRPFDLCLGVFFSVFSFINPTMLRISCLRWYYSSLRCLHWLYECDRRELCVVRFVLRYTESPKTICFAANDTSCLSKKGEVGDFDFVMLDQIWLAQFCFALPTHDPTLSHLSTARCQEQHEHLNKLSIHGLWTQYVGGFPQFCNNTGTLQPLKPLVVNEWTIQRELNNEWHDPSSSHDCQSCSMLNHEWEKHGSCLAEDPLVYFSKALEINNKLREKSKKINTFVGKSVTLSEIEELYPKLINVMCDPFDKARILEIRTCFDNKEFELIDCPVATANNFSYPCEEDAIYFRDFKA